MGWWGDIGSVGDLLDVGGLDAGDVGVHVLVHGFELVGILLELNELLLEGVEVVHGVGEGVDHGAGGAAHLGDLVLKLLHLLHLLGHLLALPLALLLELLPALSLAPALLVLLLLLLDLQDAVVHLHQQVRHLRVYLVHEVAEVGRRLVVYALEEHHRLEVLGEVLHLRPTLKLPLEDLHDLLLLGAFDLLGQVDHLLLHVDEAPDVLANLADLGLVLADYLGADALDLGVAAVGDLVDKVADSELGTLGEDVEDLLALDVAAGLDGAHDGEVGVGGLELLVAVLLARGLEEEDAVLVDEVLQKLLLLLLEHPPPLVLQLQHLADLPVVVHHREVPLGPVYYHHHALLDVLEGPEALEQVLGELGELVGPSLTDVGLVDHEDHLHLRVDVQQPLHEEGVRYLVLLALVVLEARAVVECQVVNHQLVRNRRLRVLFVPNLDQGVGAVQDRLQALVPHYHLLPRQERQDRRLTHARVPDHYYRLVAGRVLRDPAYPQLYHLLYLQQVQGAFHSNDLIIHLPTTLQRHPSPPEYTRVHPEFTTTGAPQSARKGRKSNVSFCH